MPEFKFYFNDDVSYDKFVIFAAELLAHSEKYIYYGSIEGGDETKINLSIPYGITHATYKDHIFTFEYILNDKIVGCSDKANKLKEFSITINCDNCLIAKALLRDFAIDANLFFENKKSNIIEIHTFNSNNGFWTKTASLSKRDIETIYLDSNEKSKIIADIEDFYQSESDYKKFGIPYKRIYLFEGPPGTGKTSLIFAIASKLNKNICMMNFSSDVTDQKFMESIRRMGKNSLLILEDVDALFAEDRKTSDKTSISFSGLLNVLDGFGRKEKLIVFLTTNYIDKLDIALKRAGRIDYVIKFEFAKKSQIKLMFEKFFPNQVQLFDKFYSHIASDVNGKNVTTAILQKFFFDNRRCDDITILLSELTDLIEYYKKPDPSKFYS